MEKRAVHSAGVSTFGRGLYKNQAYRLMNTSDEAAAHFRKQSV